MLKSKPKIQKRLAKIVMASLLLSATLPGMMSPSVAYAEVATTVYGTVTKDGVTKDITSQNLSQWEVAAGNISHTYEISGQDWDATREALLTATTVQDYTVTLDNFNSYYYYGAHNCAAKTVTKNTLKFTDGSVGTIVGGAAGGGYFYAADVLDNKVDVDGGNVYVAIGGYSTPGNVENAIPAGNATGNTVNVNGGNVSVAVGGMTEGSSTLTGGGNANDNFVNVNGGTVDTIAGGSTMSYGHGFFLSEYDSGGTANGNHVTINAGTINGGPQSGIYGGYSGSGDTEKNIVTINGGTFSSTLYDEDAGEDIETPMYIGVVAGGVSQKGNATENTVTIGAGNFYQVYGGLAAARGLTATGGASETSKRNATGNTVNIEGGSVGYVSGGATTNDIFYGYPKETDGSANENKVNISGGSLGLTIEQGEDTYKMPGFVYGGVSFNEASDNKVTIKGGNADGAFIMGGGIPIYYALELFGETDEDVTIQPKADNNKVNILTPINAGVLFGGFIPDGKGNFGGGSGNTLNVAAKNVSTYVVGGFQNMNFYLPSNIANGDTMLTIKSPKTVDALIKDVGDGAELIVALKYGADYDPDDDEEGTISAKKPTDLTGVTFGVAALKGVNLKKGDKVTLIKDENGLDTDPGELKTTSSEELGKAEFLQQNSMTTEEKYELSIKKEGTDSIVTYVDDVKEKKKDDPASKDAQKSPVETRIGVMNMINNASDMLAGQGLNSAAAAAKDESSGGISFAISGSDLRGESGSHVDTKGISMNLGFAKEVENKSGKLLFAPFIEYGHGSYDSYQDNGMSADGKANYWGIGIIARQTNNNGFYYEGSIRGGRSKSDYGSDSIVKGSHISYDSSATYFAAHLGAGKVMDIGHDNTLDYYGKYFYSHTGSDSATIYRDGAEFDEINFSGVNSSRIRLGARITHAINEQNKIYGGLAYQYEFSGEARATYRQGEAPSPSMKGSSGLIELGWQVKPGKKSPMTIDVGVAGWVGKQRGITANVQANWTF